MEPCGAVIRGGGEEERVENISSQIRIDGVVINSRILRERNRDLTKVGFLQLYHTQYTVLSISCSRLAFWSVVASEAGSCIIVGGPIISAADEEAVLPRASLSSSASSLRVCCFSCLRNREHFSTSTSYAANVEKHTMVRGQVRTRSLQVRW